MNGSNIRWFTDEQQVEIDARAQVGRTASMPFVKGVAIMPDCHYGKGSTVGTVVATKGAIMPACVGVDIGCGMIAVRTSLTPAQVMPHLRTIREGIERRIPVGIGLSGMNSRILPSAALRIAELESLAKIHLGGDVNAMNARGKDWRNQLGTLGGGNHFIELCIGQDIELGGPDGGYQKTEEVWVILHSGSRGVGNKTGNYWTGVALKQAKKFMYDGNLPDPDLAYLVEHSEEFWSYMAELRWCQEFARLNREEMMDRVLTELTRTVVDVSGVDIELEYMSCPSMDGCLAPRVVKIEVPSIEVERINCHHNFVQKENYEGQNLWITRKGAIEAREGMRALIPGSMGTPSYIVTGLGNEGSYNSAPHGAGRSMSRNAARKKFDLAELTRRMQDAGIEARVRAEILDEHPESYKNIHTVINEAHSLVTPTHQLRQILNVKGD